MILSLLAFLAFTRPDVKTDVAFAHVNGQEILMDVHAPTEPSKAPLPAVIVIHGGAWVSGDKKDMTPVAQALASKGFVVANINYRLAAKGLWPAMLDDVQTAVRYMRTNAAKYNIDPNRIGACGASAGGHLAMFLGVSETRDPKPTEYAGVSSKVKAVFNFFGPCDMSATFPQYLDPVFKAVLGKEKKDAAEEIRNASPINFVDKSSAPMFIYQGLLDPLVNPDQARAAQAKYKELGLICELRLLEGVKHEIKMGDPASEKAIDEGVQFLQKYLAK